MSQPISDGGHLRFQPGLPSQYQETYGSQPRPSPAPRNFFMQSSLTFNGNNVSGLADQNQSSPPDDSHIEAENEIEIWEGEQQLDGRELQERSFRRGVYAGASNHLETEHVHMRGRPLVVEPEIERCTLSK